MIFTTSVCQLLSGKQNRRGIDPVTAAVSRWWFHSNYWLHNDNSSAHLFLLQLEARYRWSGALSHWSYPLGHWSQCGHLGGGGRKKANMTSMFHVGCVYELATDNLFISICQLNRVGEGPHGLWIQIAELLVLCESMRSACSLSHCLHCYRCARNVCRECSVRNGDSGTVKRRQGATVALRRPAGQCSAGLQHSSCLAKNVRNEVPSQLHSFSGSYIHCTAVAQWMGS